LTAGLLICTIKYMARKPLSPSPLTDSLRQTLRRAIADGLSFKRLAEETGITRQSLMGFAKGERTIYLDIADKLAVYFGVELVKRKKG
jgi:transcriptional regulator with XRE-family HTH domain